MRSYILHDGPDYRLTRWGNGTSYELVEKGADGREMSVFVQGDDAVEFEADMGRIEDNDGYTMADVCDDLWFIYETAAKEV